MRRDEHLALADNIFRFQNQTNHVWDTFILQVLLFIVETTSFRDDRTNASSETKTPQHHFAACTFPTQEH